MIVILEGMERTGKTTLKNEFAKRGFIAYKDYNHLRDMNPSTIANRLDATLNFLVAADKAGVNVVMDRFHISEIVYAVRMRGTNPSSTCSYCDQVLAQLNTVLVHCVRKVDDVYSQLHSNNLTTLKLNEMKRDFHNFIEKSEIPVKVEVDISKTCYKDFVDTVIESNKKYDYYLASPFFSKEQIEREEAVLEILRDNGFVVYAPREHGVVGGITNRTAISETFKSNIEAIQNSKKVLAITDGKDVGTIWEAGYAYGIGVPVVYYCETLGKNPFNIMLSESGIGVVKDRKALKIDTKEGTFVCEVENYE